MFSATQGEGRGEDACGPDHFVPRAEEEGLTPLQARKGGKTQIRDTGWASGGRRPATTVRRRTPAAGLWSAGVQCLPSHLDCLSLTWAQEQCMED